MVCPTVEMGRMLARPCQSVTLDTWEALSQQPSRAARSTEAAILGAPGALWGTPVLSAGGKASPSMSGLVSWDRKKTERQDKRPVQGHGLRVCLAEVFSGR